MLYYVGWKFISFVKIAFGPWPVGVCEVKRPNNNIVRFEISVLAITISTLYSSSFLVFFHLETMFEPSELQFHLFV